MQSAVSFELPFRPHYTVDCLGLFGISNPRPEANELPESRRATASQGESPWASSAVRRLPAWPCKDDCTPRIATYPSFAAFRLHDLEPGDSLHYCVRHPVQHLCMPLPRKHVDASENDTTSIFRRHGGRQAGKQAGRRTDIHRYICTDIHTSTSYLRVHATRAHIFDLDK